ncbi:MAG: hypothetical protein QXX12_01245 [Nanopusillaceae archaeon]
MSGFALNKIALIILSLITLITIIILIHIYYGGYSRSEIIICNASSEFLRRLNVSSSCYFENIMEISNNVSNYVKIELNCTRITYNTVKEIKEQIINFEVECIRVLSSITITYLCNVSYDCGRKIINISSCQIK